MGHGVYTLLLVGGEMQTKWEQAEFGLGAKKTSSVNSNQTKIISKGCNRLSCIDVNISLQSGAGVNGGEGQQQGLAGQWANGSIVISRDPHGWSRTLANGWDLGEQDISWSEDY